MSTPEFATAENNRGTGTGSKLPEVAADAYATGDGRADAGRVIIKMEKQIAQMEDRAGSAVLPIRLSKLNKPTASNKTAGCKAFSRFSSDTQNMISVR